MNILFDWCAQSGVRAVFGMIKTIVNIIRIVVPIGLVVMTTLDVIKKVINPDDKDGQKKILQRLIAAIVVFFIPLIISFVLRLIDIGAGKNTASSTSASSCWNWR